ncbi:2-hydroxychromene-2-carboxylate isomerase [Hydrogenophaga sp.]|uniref:2-hydroxychromene-2-carboxylate isomerase n=1 Tax=Hydrogenophaga sp. TaxID=1904254 RepID=UPI00262E3AC5|nr:2-hydroxychromene-2-carboxylate isomerase [Hydrogenophaga sp.]MCW5652567.1 2-hydroxychromene-2-carboxylate isomerase [Hydrogenophaga sp.]
MPSPLHFHFDFISPYGYLASLRIESLAARHGRRVEWHAMLLGVSVLKVMGLKPLMETPLKGDYIARDVPRCAREAGVVLGRTPGAAVMNPLPSARAFAWVRRHHPAQAAATAHAIYQAYWGEGRDLSTPQALQAIDVPGGPSGHALADAAGSDEAAALLRADVEASLQAGVFGSPTVVVDGEMFWGLDKLDQLDRWLTRGGW